MQLAFHSLVWGKKNMNRTNNMTENPRTAFIFNMLQLYELIRAYFPQEEKS